MRWCKVTQRITTGVIPLEVSLAHNQIDPTFGGESCLGSSVVSVIKSVVTLCTPAKNRKVGKKFSNKFSKQTVYTKVNFAYLSRECKK